MSNLGDAIRISNTPFPGLRSFSRDESELFFGREGQSDELAGKLGKSRFVAVVGTSGSGKSSLVRAGLVPSLEGGCLVKVGSNWRLVDMRPGRHPISSLAAALNDAGISDSPVDAAYLGSSSLALLDLVHNTYKSRHLAPDENLLILVDQFEEIFRYKTGNNDMDDRDEKAAFVKLLLEVAKQRHLPVFVVITMRSDFLGDCARFRDLPEAINAGQYLVPRMTRDQRRQAIEGPVHMAGGEISPRLVQRILNDVGEDPDQLPVMQHALMRTWQQWQSQVTDRPVDLQDYEAIGTLEDALSSHADEAYDEARAKVPAQGAIIVKRVLQRLRERDSSGREIRRPSSLRELCLASEASEQDVLTVLECFRREGRSFLMPPVTVNLTADGSVDITHESLLRQWKRLLGPPTETSGWLAEEEESRRTLIRLADRAEQQVQGSPDYLRGPVLLLTLDWWNKRKPTEAWANRYTPNLPAAERYLRESDENQKREAELEEEHERAAKAALLEKRQEEEQLKARQRKSRILRYAAIVALLGLTVTSVMASYAWMQRRKAEAEKQRFQEAYTWATNQNGLSEKLNARLKELNKSLVASNTDLTKATDLAEANANEADVQKRLAIAARTSAQALNHLNDQPELALLLALEAGRQGDSPETRNGILSSLQTVPNLRAVVTDHKAKIQTISYVAGELQSVDVDGAIMRHTNQGIPAGPTASSAIKPSISKFSQSGAYLYLASNNESIVRNTKNGNETKGPSIAANRFSFYLPTGIPLAFSSDGAPIICFLSADGLKLWDIANEKDLGLKFKTERKPITIALDQGAKLMATTYTDGVITLWDIHDVDKPIQKATLSGSVKTTLGLLEFDPKGRYLVAASAFSPTISFWDLSEPKPVAHPVTQTGSVSSLAFSADGTYLASGSRSGFVSIWRLVQGRQLLSWSQRIHSSEVSNVAFNRDNKSLASSEGTAISLWNIEQSNLSQVGSDPSQEGYIQSQISFTPDDHVVVAATVPITKEADPKTNTPATGGEINVRSRSTASLSQAVAQTWVGSSKTTGWARVYLSPDGQIAASEKYEQGNDPCRKSEFRIDIANSTTQTSTPISSEQTVTSAAFSSDSRALVVATCRPPAPGSKTASNQYEIIWWNPRNRLAKQERLPSPALITSIAISPDHKALVTASDDDASKLTLWNLETKRSLGIGTRAENISLLRFSPDSKKFVAASSDGTVTVWGSRDGEKIGHFNNPNGITDLSFSPDGNTVAASSQAGFVVLWDFRTLHQFGSLPTQSYTSVVTAFDPRNSGILAVSAGASITLWDINLAKWKSLACQFSHRNLSIEEWRQYGDGAYQKTCENLPVSPSLIEEARSLVHQGEVKQATELLQRVKVLDPSLHLDPQHEIKAEELAGQVQDAIERGKRIYQRQPLEALKLYQHAVALDPHAPIAAVDWNNVCWNGSLLDVAAKTMVACEKAVSFDPNNVDIRDSRGLARALVGDLQGAISDFQSYIDHGSVEEYKQQRREWVKDLQAQQNPFKNPDVLKTLQSE